MTAFARFLHLVAFAAWDRESTVTWRLFRNTHAQNYLWPRPWDDR